MKSRASSEHEAGPDVVGDEPEGEHLDEEDQDPVEEHHVGNDAVVVVEGHRLVAPRVVVAEELVELLLRVDEEPPPELPAPILDVELLWRQGRGREADRRTW